LSPHDLRPLKRNYSREPAVVQDILHLESLPENEFWRRMTIQDYQAPDCPRLESMVYFIRLFVSRNDQEAAWRMIEKLIQRTTRTILRRLNCFYIASMDQREELQDELIHRLYEEWLSLDGAHEFWEVRFGVCLDRRLADVVKRYERENVCKQSLHPSVQNENKEDPIANLPDLRPDPLRDVEVREALAYLPEPCRTAIYLYTIEQWTEEQIASYFKKTSRTVRNYLMRARRLLREWYSERME
jgi:DNA-directed RNA polymerase specialized sigma24 family protein